MLNRVLYKSDSLDDTKIIASFFTRKFINKDKAIITLTGDLGSGKTTFVRYVLNSMGISDRQFEGSPTFTIVNEYSNNIFHIDLYRLNTKDDIENIGLYDILDKNGIFLIEWPKYIKFQGTSVTFEIINENTRKIIIDRR